MLTFNSVTKIEFASAEDLEAFVKQMPWPPHETVSVLDDREHYVETNDQVDFPGAGKTTHEFWVEGEEE